MNSDAVQTFLFRNFEFCMRGAAAVAAAAAAATV
jgi:hypothetical protein